jgi:hypothetical protein
VFELGDGVNHGEGTPIFMAIPNLEPRARPWAVPRMWRTVPDPSISGCRAGSAMMSKTASGLEGMTLSTDTTSTGSAMARSVTLSVEELPR